MPRGRTERGTESTTRSDSHPHSPRLPAHGHPAAAAPGARGNRPRYLPAPRPCSGRSRTRNRNPAQHQPLQEARASHAGSGKLPFRPFPPAWCGHGDREALPDRVPGPLPPAALPPRLSGAGTAPGAASPARAEEPGGKEKRSGKRPISARLLAGAWPNGRARC